MQFSNLLLRLSRPAEGFYTSEVAYSPHLPVHTFLPTGYEPRYAYPLVVFFHGNGGDAERVLQLAPRISRRNFVCISLRGPKPVTLDSGCRLGYSWGPDDASDVMLEDYVFSAIEQTQDAWSIHPQRIFLAGIWEGATLAYRLGLTFPERFAGIVSLNGAMTRRRRPLLRLPEVKRVRVFIGHGIANALVPSALAKADHRLLYTAGLDVTLRTYPTTHRLHTEMLKDVNRWLVEQSTRPHPSLVTR